MPFCPECGNQVIVGKKFCFICGERLPVQNVSNPETLAPRRQVYSSMGVDFASSRTVPEHRIVPEWTSEDQEAVQNLKLFAILEIVGLVMAVAVPIVISGSLLESLLGFGSIFSSPARSAAYFGSSADLNMLVLVIVVFGFVLGIVAAIKIRSAFGSLSAVDRGFSSPKTLSISLIVGLSIGFIGSTCLIFGILAVVAAATRGSFSLLSEGSLLMLVGGGLLALGVVGIIIGGIGVALGIWRAGGRYNQTTLKVSAILHLIPFLFLIAPLFLYAGVRGAGEETDYASEEVEPVNNNDPERIAQLRSLDEGKAQQG